MTLALYLIALLGGLLFGYDTGNIAGALRWIADDFHLNSTHQVLKEFIISSVPIGAFFGALFSSYSSKHLGRRSSIHLATVLSIFGLLIMLFSFVVAQVIIGRLLMGFAIGIVVMTVPMYISELSFAKVRGRTVFLFQLGITGGIFLGYLANFLLASFESWRFLFAIELLPPIVLGVAMFFMPQSPRWLVMKGRKQQAENILSKLRGNETAATDLVLIEKSLGYEGGGFRLLFSRQMIPLLVITVILFALQQLSGINAIFYYAPTIFEKAGFSKNLGVLVSSMGLGLINILASIAGVYLIDHLGRRKLLLFGLIGMFICMALLGSSFLNHIIDGDIRALVLACVFVFVIFFAVSLGGVPYVIMSELFPLNVKGAGMALASGSNWGFNILISSTFLTLVASVGIGITYWIYGGFILLGLIFAFFFMPETKGRSLEEIESNLYAGKSLKHLGD